MPNYVSLLVLATIVLGFAISTPILSRLIGKARHNPEKDSTYECGVPPIGNARERFPIKFYLIAMLFIVFDIETVFLYPWAVTYNRQHLGMKVFYFGEMAVFVIILFVGYFYILGKGALDWEESEQKPNSDVITPEVVAKRPKIRFGNEGSGPVDLSKVPAGPRFPVYGASSQEEFQSYERQNTYTPDPSREKLLK